MQFAYVQQKQILGDFKDANKNISIFLSIVVWIGCCTSVLPCSELLLWDLSQLLGSPQYADSVTVPPFYIDLRFTLDNIN